MSCCSARRLEAVDLHQRAGRQRGHLPSLQDLGAELPQLLEERGAWESPKGWLTQLGSIWPVFGMTVLLALFRRSRSCFPIEGGPIAEIFIAARQTLSNYQVSQ